MNLAAVVGLLLAGFTSAVTQSPSPTPTPAPIREQVIVTASRTERRIGDTPASVITLSRAEIETSAAATVDDVLRQAVGFSIFRRSSSRNANPTTQGVSMRGVGASGASRSVVMFDGVPLNDPFGGWIQWNRVAPVELETVEVLRGGAANLYGDSGLSGAVNMIPAELGDTDKGFAAADIFAGNQKTVSGSGSIGRRLLRSWLANASGALYQTRGYKPIDASVRGPVDSFAGVRSSNLRMRVARKFGSEDSLFFAPSMFGEVRTNGTGLQTNRTHIRQLVFGGEIRRAVHLRWRAYGGTQVFDQVFSSVNAPRTAEFPTRVQRVPVQNVGLSATLSRVVGDHQIVGGVDARNVRGASDELVYTNGIATSLIGPGGRQTAVGAFIQDIFTVGPRVVISGSLRVDRWNNYAALSSTRSLSTGATATVVFPAREASAVSPQLAALIRVNDRVSLYANASGGFRSPTLNELYRAFRVGNVLTLANENLRAERGKNFEAGATWGKGKSYLRASGFLTQINESVANVTLATTPSLITRQRQNAGATRSKGLEIEGETAVGKLSISAGYLYVSPTVTRFPTNPVLIGVTIPQVARHQFTAQTRYAAEKWTVALQARASSSQFDDDLNQFRLEPYFQADLFASRWLSRNLQFYGAVENVFNSRYSIGRTPIRTVSSPTTIRLGFRWRG